MIWALMVDTLSKKKVLKASQVSIEPISLTGGRCVRELMVLNKSLGLWGLEAIRREKYFDRSSFSVLFSSFNSNFMAM